MFRLSLFLAVLAAAQYSTSYELSFGLMPLTDERYRFVMVLIKVVSWLGVIFEMNALLSFWADNKWMLRDDRSVWDWNSEVAVVTGGSQGIGAAVVKRLTSYGIRVAVLDVKPLSEDLEHDGGNLVRFYHCDITSRRAVREAAEAIRSDFAAPSILINNAGIGNANTILEISPERLQAAFQVNIISHWNTVQEFLPDMIAKKKGHIMATASLAAFMTLSGSVDYAATKAGLLAFHEGLTQELKHRYNAPQIKTSIAFPNWTKTNLNTAIQERLQQPMLKPEQVAVAMVNQIVAARSGYIVVGPWITPFVRASPTWFQELVRDSMAKIVTVNATSATDLA